MKVGCNACVITEARLETHLIRDDVLHIRHAIVATNGVRPALASHGVVTVWVHHVQTTLWATDGWACFQAQPKLDDTLEVARWQGEAEIGQW